jgi:hypothetical protein
MRTKADPRKVFVIHGRNLAAREQMGVFLRSLGLVPINFGDLRAQMGGTPTIADIVEQGMSEAQGVIALMTADEFSALRPAFRRKTDDADDTSRWQARPNVIFEAGMAFGRDRNRVVFVLLGDVRLFTDLAGVHVLRPTNDPKGDRSVLRGTLGQGMRCAIEPHSSDWMTSGDFEGCIMVASESARDPFTVLEATYSDEDVGRRVAAYREVLASVAALRAAMDILETDFDWNTAPSPEAFAPTNDLHQKAVSQIERNRADTGSTFADAARAVIEFWDTCRNHMWERMYDAQPILPSVEQRLQALHEAIPDSYRDRVAPGHFEDLKRRQVSSSSS